MKPKFKGKIEKGVFVPDWPEQRQAYIEGLEGKVVEEILGLWSEPKTYPQLKYFHGVICMMASEASGYTPKEVKDILKGEFLTEYIKSPTGKEVPRIPSLANLKKFKMMRLIDDSIILCAKWWHVVIPPPEQVEVT